MTSQQQRAKKGGWGSILSGAVAGIESRLDNILAEENALAAQKAGESTQPNGLQGGISNPTVSRTPSARKKKPIAAPGRIQTPQSAQKAANPRRSTDSISSDSPAPAAKTDPGVNEEPKERRSTEDEEVLVRFPMETLEKSGQTSEPAQESAIDTNGCLLEQSIISLKSPRELQSELQQVRADYENVELRRQEEVHDYLERIDTLQAKVQYLAKEASEAARMVVTESGKEALEKKLAEKDQKIALLLEEGSKLSKSEVSQLGMIRGLKAEKSEQTNSIADLRRRLAILENSSREHAYEVSKLEAERKEALTRASRVLSLESEVAVLTTTISNKNEKIKCLEEDVQEARARADDGTRQRNAEALDLERATSSSLRDQIHKLRNELDNNRDQSKSDLNKAQERIQGLGNRSQATETALKNEIATLEGRLEIMRSKTEESTATNASDSNAKLMRQVEVLQRQYSVANENWQGIEASLQSRITALEKERDESTKHENEARRKAREAGSSSRKLHDQLEDATQRIRMLEQEVAEQQANGESLQKKTSDFEKQLQEAKEQFHREKQNLNASLNAKLEEERAKWQSQTQSVEPSIFSGSPHPSNPRRTSTLDLPGLSSRKQDRRSSPNFITVGTQRDPHSRRSSALPPTNTSHHVTSPANDSEPSTPFFGTSVNALPTLSIHTNDRETDDEFENTSSPRRTINDMVSASTAAAGPSVQLVERMSASVRRLETEKASNKEELVRLSKQRDDARKEVVNLMQEVEGKRDVDKKAEKLEKDLNEMQRRYAASLEMLGEKEEKVGELEADIADLKKIYRELVERTVK